MNVLQNPLLLTLDWTLFHSLWELAAIAAIAVLFLRLFRRTSASVRYIVCYTCLLAMAAAPIITYTTIWKQAAWPKSAHPLSQMDLQNPAASPLVGINAIPAPSPLPTKTLTDFVTRFAQANFRYASVLYLTVCSLMLLRLTTNYIALQRIRTRAFLVSDEHYLLLRSLQKRLQLISTPIELVRTAEVEVPTVIGALRPIILLPASALTGLSADQLTCLIVHELAHIRRHDFLANVLQSAIEALLFYHPAVYWLSKVIRQEREHCCDDLTIATLSDRHAYANALAHMESLRTLPAPALGASSGLLVHRIRRILDVESAVPFRLHNTNGPTIFLLIAVATIGFYFAACSSKDSPTTAASTSQPTATDHPNTNPNRIANTGDVLHLTIYGLLGERENYDDLLSVDSAGKLQVLFLGDVVAIGKTPRELEETIAQELQEKNLMRNAEVRVELYGGNISSDIGPLRIGEKILTRIFGIDQPNQFLDEMVFVDEKGDVPVRHMGRLHVAGLTTTQAADFVAKQAVKENLMSPPVYVRVRRPLPYELSGH